MFNRQKERGGIRRLNGGVVQLDLTTVQLFDLVEAVDQFFADSQTLPDLSLRLAPVSKRYSTSNQPLVKQAVPAAVGVSSLAIAAIAFFLVPLPQPQEPKPASSSQSNNLPARNLVMPIQRRLLSQKLLIRPSLMFCSSSFTTSSIKVGHALI